MIETMDRTARNARTEAAAVAGANVRVLEPSPPAVAGDFFADDPAVADEPDAVTPTSATATTWNDLAAANPTIAEYARDHWLGPYKPLAPVPADYVIGRHDFHRLAYGVVSNARKQVNGKFGLRYTHRGFGTPFFGEDQQVRVEGNDLIVQRGDSAISEPITTLEQAAKLAGTVANAAQAEHDTIELGDLDRMLETSAEVGEFLGDWFGFVASVLEEIRLLGDDNDNVSRVQIWPGHFDPAIEIGNADAGHRGSYGGSPGDAHHDEPYLYVGPWGDVDGDHPHWNAVGYTGAGLAYAALLTADDPRAMAIAFFARSFELSHA
jgi:hypothetical protein